MINLDTLISGLKSSFSATVGPILNGLGKTISPAVKPIENEATKITALIPKYLTDRIQSNTQAPSFAGFAPLQIVDQIRSAAPIQSILNMPLIPKTPGLGLAGYLSNEPNPASPTIGQYFKNQVVDPLKSGVTDIQKKGIGNKALGALQILGGVFGATPPGLVFNVGTGAVAGGLRTIRTGEDWQKSMREGIGSPTSIAQSGLGVQNPWLALGLDLVLTSPKETVNIANRIFKPQLAENLVKNTVKSKERQLYELLNYENELEKRGFTEGQRAKLGIQKARQVLGWTEEAATEAIDKARTFAQAKRATFDKLFAEWLGARDTAKTIGTDYAVRYAKIPVQIGWDVIRGLEGAKDVVPEASPYIQKLRATFDDLHALANKSGLDTNYLDSYITHIWKQSPEEVQATYKAVARKFKFSLKRQIPTYEQGIQAGLVPLYSHPAQILESYVRNMESIKANLIFFNKLKGEGMIVDAAIGVGKIGFSPITAPGIPPSKGKNVAGELVHGPFYAPDLIARLVNKLFSPEDTTTLGKILDFTARVSGKFQDLSLAGGIPYTNVNAFALMAGGQRELLAGRVKTTANFLETFSQGRMLEWFHEHSSSVKEMQRRNIPMNTIYKAENFIDKGLLENIFGGGIGAAWNRAVNEKTFRSYLPSLQVSFFEDVRDAALQKGKGAEEALDIAAEATKKFYGIVSSDALAKQSKIEQDLKTTLLFAPKFRESIINFWTNNIKAISPLHLETDGGLKVKFNNPLDLKNIYNTRFVVGATINYLLFDQLNLRTVGRHLSENPPGTETTLLIPTGSDNKDVIGIPFLSSLGTIPLTLGKMGAHVAEGNFPQVMKDASGFPSLAIKAPMDILNNENFYGQEIYNVNDPAKEKAKDIGRHLLENYSHPYVRTASELGLIPGIPAKNQPLIATVSKTLELPVRYYTEDKLNARYYYGNRDKAFRGISGDLADFKGDPTDPSDDTQTQMTKAAIRLAQPQILRAETQTAKETAKQTGKPIAPFYTLPEPYQLVVLRYQSLPPGNTDKKAILTAQPWLKEYWSANNAYYQANPITSKAPQLKPIATPYMQAQMDAKNWNDPQVQAFLNENSQYTNNQRLALQLPPIEKSSGFSRFTKRAKTKKVKFKKLKLKKLKIKAPKLTIRPLVKLRVPKYA